MIGAIIYFAIGIFFLITERVFDLGTVFHKNHNMTTGTEYSNPAGTILFWPISLMMLVFSVL